MSKVLLLLCVLLCAFCTYGQEITQGSLYAAGKNGKELGECPLKNTQVKTEISGFMARVNVRQEFENSFTEPIEAIYTFPLSQNGAVDSMTMYVGSRTVRAKIMKREEARQVYENAKSDGKTAALLDQERPNIFTQSVANIMPGEKIVIEISYVEALKYEDGAYEFVFPMTVGPRYIPGSVKDAAKIRPSYTTTRNGSDISIEVNLNAGVPVEEIRSSSHEIAQTNFSPSSAKISLQNGPTIPNKDFILRYDVTGKRIEDAVLTHRDERGGFFTLILQPPDKIADEDRTPKEIVFVLDTSGSMYGFPIEKAKEAMRLSLDGLYPDDTFNLITFAGHTSILFDGPVPATQANLERAKAFLDSHQGGGGTEMMKAIKASLDPSDSKDHLRIVCFMTDGYVGNESEIVAEIQRHPNARVFSFGIGDSVNRHLLDKMAEAGKGEVEYVGLKDDGSKAARRFYERVRTPLLTDLSIDWNGMPVVDVYPSKLTDLFSAKPVVVHGRYKDVRSGTIKLKGKVAGQPYERDIKLELPQANPANESLASLWARVKISELTMDKLQYPEKHTDYDRQIADLALEYRLMSEFTSFVAVEERVVNNNGVPRTVEVPVLVPEGVKPETTIDTTTSQVVTVSGSVAEVVDVSSSKSSRKIRSSNKAKRSGKSGGGTGSGSGYGSGTGNGMGPTTASGGGAGAGNASVMVTADAAAMPANTPVTVIPTISSKTVEALPKGTTYTSLLRTMSATQAEPLGGQFTINGTNGSQNTFVIDGQEVGNLRSGYIGSGQTLVGRATAMAEPVYPKDSDMRGEVAVEFATDREGTIVSAKAVSGPEILREAAEAAAMLSKFAPVYVNGRGIRFGGIIGYNFKDKKSVEITLKDMKALPLTDADKAAFALSEKLHHWLYDLVMRLEQKRIEPGANDARFVKNGIASIRITLKTDDPASHKKLRQAGLQVDGAKGKTILGRIEVGKLASLAAVPEVAYVIPKT